MTINTFTLVSASGKKRTEVTISEGDKVVKQYRRRNLGPLGPLRLHTGGTIEYSFGKYVSSRAITLRGRNN